MKREKGRKGERISSSRARAHGSEEESGRIGRQREREIFGKGRGRSGEKRDRDGEDGKLFVRPLLISFFRFLFLLLYFPFIKKIIFIIFIFKNSLKIIKNLEKNFNSVYIKKLYS